jgi:hypothetical protein
MRPLFIAWRPGQVKLIVSIKLAVLQRQKRYQAALTGQQHVVISTRDPDMLKGGNVIRVLRPVGQTV